MARKMTPPAIPAPMPTFAPVERAEDEFEVDVARGGVSVEVVLSVGVGIERLGIEV
jgi:hypothetical protein